MRLLITISLCVLAFGLANCGEPSGEYLPPVEVSQEYIPPFEEAAPAATLADDGYRYKAVKRVKYRHRREVSNEYLPPVEGESDVLTYNEALGPVPADVAPAHSLADDGYRYKAVKRHRFRHRRDVSELSNEYLPPVQQGEVQTFEQAAPAPVQFVESEPAHTLADDGYRYKAVKKYRFRHRRDVNELSNEYLPPVQQEQVQTFEQAAPAPVQFVESEPAHTLADDGYRYKAVKKYRFRHRRDVSELNNEYLPPVQEQGQTFEQAAPAPVQFVEAEPAHTLADDGYRYKAVKKYRFRHRRDVSELNNEYLPPVQEQGQTFEQAAPAPVQFVEAEPAHTLADDGYRYKAVKKLRFRHRRDVSEINNEYLPPVQEQQAQVFEQAAPATAQFAEPEPAHTLADDGYRYKAVKKYRFRHRRDVSELNNEYLPPVQEQGQTFEQAAPAPVQFIEAEPAHTLADDGYRYKAVKKYRFRHRRDVNELSNEYLPPVQQEQVQTFEQAAPAPVQFVESEPAHTLADDGYRYKAVRKYRLRHRRDVNELSNEYLPPVQQGEVQTFEQAAPAPVQFIESEPAHTLADDGYRYKAVRKYRLRHRRDVSELNNEYLPPVQEQQVQTFQEAAPAPVQSFEAEPAHTLADDGYRYKAVKKYRFRHRRDVSELSNEYLPPVQEVSQEYLPPVAQVAQPIVHVAEPAPAHTFGDDGYKYKTIKRRVFRHRY